jgi:hypothetical protein
VDGVAGRCAGFEDAEVLVRPAPGLLFALDLKNQELPREFERDGRGPRGELENTQRSKMVMQLHGLIASNLEVKANSRASDICSRLGSQRICASHTSTPSLIYASSEPPSPLVLG